MVEKFENMFSRFDTILACDRQMDRQTSCHGSWHSVFLNAEHSVVKQYLIAVTGLRGKKYS